MFAAPLPLVLVEAILAARMILSTVAFVLRVVHRATKAPLLRLAAMMLTTLLAIHGRTAKTIAAISGALIRFAVAIIGGIHRPTLPVTLRLYTIARTSHIRAALRLTHGVWSGPIAIPLHAGAR